MQKVLLYIFLFASFCGIIEWSVNYTVAKQIKSQSPYCLSFSSIGANLLESRIDCWAKIKTTSSTEEMDQNLIIILNHLQLPVENHKFVHAHNNNGDSLEYDCQKSAATFRFILQSDQKQKDLYILISILSKQENLLPAYEKKLAKLLDCNCYYLYTGTINYNLSPSSQADLLKVVTKQMDATLVDTYQQDNTTSITAFSPKLSGTVKPIDAGLNKVNVQAALRSNPRDNQTYVYIGSPIILGEY